MSGGTTYTRDRETVRTVAGVRVNPGHWAAQMVHAFWTWTGEHTLLTWCSLGVDLEAGARQTTDLISCLACAQASWLAFRSGYFPATAPATHGTEGGR